MLFFASALLFMAADTHDIGYVIGAAITAIGGLVQTYLVLRTRSFQSRMEPKIDHATEVVEDTHVKMSANTEKIDRLASISEQLVPDYIEYRRRVNGTQERKEQE